MDLLSRRWLPLVLPLVLLVVAGLWWWSGERAGNAFRGRLEVKQETIPETRDQVREATAALRGWLKGEGSATEERREEGVRLAEERREVMKRLIRENPRQAVEESLSFGEWAELPEEIRNRVEKPFSVVADFSYYPVCQPPGVEVPLNAPAYVAELALADGGRWEAFVYGERTGMGSKRRLPVQGVVLDGLAAVRSEPLQPLSDADAVALAGNADWSQADGGKSFVTGKPVGPEAQRAISGGRVFVFADAEELRVTNERLSAADLRPGPVAATSYLLPEGDGTLDWSALESFAEVQASAWTEQKKKVFLIRVNFSNNTAVPVTQPAAATVINGTVSDQIRAISYGKTWIEAEVSANVYQMPQVTSYYTNSGSGLNSELLRDARNTFRNTKSGGDAAINIGPVSNTGSGSSNGLGSYDIVGVTFSGIGMISGGVSYAGLAGGGDLWMQGNNSSGVYVHEFGHNYGIGHASSWDTTNGTVVGTGTSTEYGDPFDIMGSGPDPEGQFHTQAKAKLDWLTSSQWADATALGSNTYRIYRIDDTNTTSTTLRGVRVTKGSGEYYWLGYRAAQSNTALRKGVYLNWQRSGETRCWLLDTTPNSAGGKSDAAITLGRTYSDTAANVHVTPLAVGGSGADQWLDVRVNVGTFAGNGAPTVGAISGPTTVQARTSATFSVSATDPNGDALAYDWNTRDGLVNDSQSSVTHTWLTGGTYQLDVTVSDMKGGTQTVSKTITVIDPLDTWTTQTTNHSGYLRSAVWGEDRFVVVEYFGEVLTSWDGVTWSSAGYLPDFDQEPKLAYGNGVFVAAGKKSGASAAQVCVSTDGRTWSVANFPAGIPQIRDIAYGAGRFVAVGESGTVLNSTDGVNWSLTTVGGSPAFRRVACDGAAWLAIATNGGSGQEEDIWTSTNGTSWSQGGELNFDVYGVKGLAGRLYAVGWYGGIQVSLDHGLTWQAATLPGSTRWSTGMIERAADGTYLATAKAMDESGFPQALLISSDGLTWARSSAGTSFGWDVQALVYGHGRFLASADGGVVRTSDSLFGSNQVPVAAFDLAPTSVPARSNRLFAASATDADGDALAYYWDFGVPNLITDGASTVKAFDAGGTYTGTLRVFDGKGGMATLTRTVTVTDPARQYTQRTSGTTNALNAIASNGTIAVAVGDKGTIRTSADGVTWTTRSVSESTTNVYFKEVKWNGSMFVMVGEDYDFAVPGWVALIYSSSDGMTWTRRLRGSTPTTTLRGVSYSSGGEWVAVGDSGTVLESANGTTWNAVTISGVTSTLATVACDGTNFVISGYSGGSGSPRSFTSTNRTAWTEVTSGLGVASWQDVRKLSWLNNRFVGSGWYSKVRVSTDGGATFTTTRANTEYAPAMAYGDGLYFAAGEDYSNSNADVDLVSLDGVTWLSAPAPTTANRNGATFFKHTFITVGAGGSIWQSGDLTPGGASNQAPAFAGYAATTPPATQLTIPVTTLVGATSDGDGDVVLLTAVGSSSVQGGAVSMAGGQVKYLPAGAFTGSDSFTVTFTDARGATVSGSVQVTVQSSASGSPGVVTLSYSGTGSAGLSYQGVAGQVYTIQRSVNLTGWTNLGTVTAAPNGAVVFTDSNPPPDKAFYRIVLP